MKKQIYSDGTSKLTIEFDDEYFHITQTILELEELTISVTKNEIEEMLKFATEIHDS
jgi:hypothetical protein